MTASISDLASQVRARQKHDAWWKDPRWVRLLTILSLIMVLSILTNQTQGSSADYGLELKNSWFSGRGLKFLLGGAVVWAATEAWRARGLSKVASRAAQPVRDVRKSALVQNVWTRRAILLVACVVLVALPNIGLFATPFYQGVLADQVGIFVLLAIGLNVVVGWAGLLDLGYIAFFAIGAYTTAILTGRLPVGDDGNVELHPPFHLNPFVAFPIAVLATLAAGLILGAPTLRLRGDYLAIVTLGFHEIVLKVAANDPHGLTNGPLGATGIPPFSVNLLGVHYNWSSADSKPYWYLVIAIIGLVVFAFSRLEHSKVGRSWTAIREDEVAAAASGVPTIKYKLMAFAIGASTSGFAGVLIAAQITAITPDNFPLPLSIFVLAYVIFGGMGSLTGVAIGASLMTFLPQFLQGPPSWFNGGKPVVDQKDIPMWIGAILLAMMIFRPQGLIPSKRRAQELGQAEAGIGGADAVSVPAEGVAP